MGDKQQFLDVWIVETNVVYRQVPYNVVADWVQQGRLIETDRLRSAGKGEWLPLADMPAFAPYLPKPDQFRAEDRAEALEPVEIELGWKRPAPDEDEDVDMIPLIDVSLVLLIFFMMTASVVGAAGLFNTPKAYETTELTNDPNMIWVGINRTADNKPIYYIGQGGGGAERGDGDLSERELLQRLDARLKAGAATDVRIRADRGLSWEVVKNLTMALEKKKSNRSIGRIYAEVSGKEEQ
jgi:biopolymer transport protein ExbD